MKWPTIYLDIKPYIGEIWIHSSGKSFTETINPGEFFTVSIGDYQVTFARKRDKGTKIMQLPKREKLERHHE